jgi:Domain of Unknown Function (DUF1080)
MKRYIITVITLLLSCSPLLLAAQTPRMAKIFNRKNLKGWKVPEGNVWWSAGRGQLLAKSTPDKKGSILWTEKAYTNFIIRLDFKMIDGTVDSGVFLRSETDQIQIGISGSLKRDMTASPYIPGLRYPVEAKGVAQVLKPKDWNTLQIKVVDKTYTVWLNGTEVMTYTSEKIVPSGPIGLQLHPNTDMTIRFRRIAVGDL